MVLNSDSDGEDSLQIKSVSVNATDSEEESAADESCDSTDVSVQEVTRESLQESTIDSDNADQSIHKDSQEECCSFSKSRDDSATAAERESTQAYLYISDDQSVADDNPDDDPSPRPSDLGFDSTCQQSYIAECSNYSNSPSTVQEVTPESQASPALPSPRKGNDLILHTTSDDSGCSVSIHSSSRELSRCSTLPNKPNCSVIGALKFSPGASDESTSEVVILDTSLEAGSSSPEQECTTRSSSGKLLQTGNVPSMGAIEVVDPSPQLKSSLSSALPRPPLTVHQQGVDEADFHVSGLEVLETEPGPKETKEPEFKVAHQYRTLVKQFQHLEVCSQCYGYCIICVAPSSDSAYTCVFLVMKKVSRNET